MNDDDLRNATAMLALNGMLSVKDWFSNSGRWKSTAEMQKAYAEEAYGFADAMVAASKKRYWVEPEEEDEEDGIASVAKRPYKRRTK